MMGHARAKRASSSAPNPDGGAPPANADSDSDTDLVSVTTVGDRVARNKPRKMLKKNRVGRRSASRREAAEPERVRVGGGFVGQRVSDESEAARGVARVFSDDVLVRRGRTPGRGGAAGFDLLEEIEEESDQARGRRVRRQVDRERRRARGRGRGRGGGG